MDRKTNSLGARKSPTLLTTLMILMVVSGFGTGSVEIAIAVTTDLPALPFETYQLANGLDVILNEDHSLPTVCVNVWYHAGSRNELPGTYGLAHLSEHLMGQGTVNSDVNYMDLVSRIGGDTNGATWEDATDYWVSVPSNQLAAALWLYADMMGFLVPALTEEKLANEREVVINEKRQIEGEPYAAQDSILKALLYPPDHPYSRTIIGLMEDLQTITLSDVTDYYERFYIPNNASLCIAGDFDPAEAKAMVAKYFGPISPGPSPERNDQWLVRLDGIRRATVTDAVELPRLYCAWHTPPHYQTDDSAVDLLARILGSGETSRLHQKLVRERGIAHELSARRDPYELGSQLHIVITARAGQDLDGIEEALDEEITRIIEEGISHDELECARTLHETDLLRGLEAIDGFGGRADLLNEFNLFNGNPGYLPQQIERYRLVTTDDVRRCASQYLDLERRVILRILPTEEFQAEAVDFDRSVCPPAGPTPGFLPPAIQWAHLENGLDLYLVEKHDLPLVQLTLLVRSGWAADPANRPGVSNLTATLLDAGTRSRSSQEIADDFARLGGDWSPISSYDWTVFSLNLSRRQASAGLDRMCDVVLNPAFPEDELERLKTERFDQLRVEAALPHATSIKTLQKLVFGERHPYAQPYTGSGTPEALQAIKRADLVQFHRQHYVPGNCALVIVGDLTLAEAQDMVERSWRKWHSVPPPHHAQAVPVTPIHTTSSSPRIHLVDRPGAEQSFITVGHPSLGRGDDDYLSVNILNNILGGQYESRLNMNLREDKGYTYGYHTFLLSLRHGGMLIGFGSVDTEHTGEALVEILREWRDVGSDRPVEATEFEGEKVELVEGFPRQFKTARAISRNLVDLLIYDQPLNHWNRYAGRVTAIDLEVMRRAARDYIHPEALHILVAGDREAIEVDLQALGLGEITLLDDAGLAPEDP